MAQGSRWAQTLEAVSLHGVEVVANDNRSDEREH